ncbi:MAG TPA: SDR family oxidoreductase [Pseudogracilibacillus sp.]|nr:SDR family oxidoreductase [Pseudogracilibacillus sp.]
MNTKNTDISSFNMNFFNLKGKTALITGGNSGLGQGFSLALAKAGADIFVVSMFEDDDETKRLVEKEGRKYHLEKADITKDNTCKDLVEKGIQIFGKIDILINNAGINITEEEVTNFSRVQWDKMVAVNLTSSFEMINEVASHMISRNGGKVINTCSLFSFLGGKKSPAYAATKHGLAGLTKAYCDELGEYNIQVNGIAPGYFATAVTKQTRADSIASNKILEHIPAKRWGNIIDLMGTVVYLASDASNYVNGSIIAVDGGFLTR